MFPLVAFLAHSQLEHLRPFGTIAKDCHAFELPLPSLLVCLGDSCLRHIFGEVHSLGDSVVHMFLECGLNFDMLLRIDF